MYVPVSVRPHSQFAFSHRPLDADTTVIAVEGDLDLDAAPKLKWELTELAEQGHRKLIVDVSGVTFMDSTGLGVLVGVRRRLHGEGVVAIACPSAAIVNLFEVTGLDRTFDLCPTVSAAHARLREVTLPAPSADSQRAGGPAKPGAAGDQDVRAPVRAAEPVRGVPVPLSGDAAVVVGLASTALAFSRTPGEQVERWLRALSHNGEAGFGLTALGFTEDPLDPEREEAIEHASPDTGPAAPDAVATVTQAATELAARRGVSKVATSDLLDALMDVYGEVFEQVLMNHGIGADELIERIRDSG